MHSDPPREGHVCPGPGGQAAAWPSHLPGRSAHTGRGCPDLIGSSGPAACAGLRPGPRRGREEVAPPALLAPPPAAGPVPATWPDPAPSNWVGREATGGRRLQRDYAPVSRNLSKWTGQAGPLRAGVIQAAAPTPARPGTAGEPVRAAERGRLAPRLREARAGLTAGDGSRRVRARPCTHTARRGPDGPPRLVTHLGPHTLPELSPSTLTDGYALTPASRQHPVPRAHIPSATRPQVLEPSTRAHANALQAHAPQTAAGTSPGKVLAVAPHPTKG